MTTPRLVRRVRRDFPAPGSADEILAVLDALPDKTRWPGPTPERIQAAVVLSAGGDVSRFLSAVDLAEIDWRDALMAADLGNTDWAERLERELGPAG